MKTRLFVTLAAALAAALSAGSAFSQDDTALLTQATTLLDAGRYADALPLFRVLSDSSNDSVARDAMLGRARCVYKIGQDYRAARDLYLQVAERWPGTPAAGAGVRFAGYACLKFDRAEATSLFERAAAEFPGTEDSTDSKLRLGYLATLDGDLQKAEMRFWEAASDPAQTLERKATAYTQYGYAAIMRYFKATDADEPDAAANLVRARERLSAAVAWLRDQPGMQTGATFCQVGIAESYYWGRQLPEAEAAYREALAACGEGPSALEMLARHGLAAALFLQNRQAEALPELRRTLELAATKPEAALSIPVSFIRFDSGVLNAMILWRTGSRAEALAAIAPFADEAQATPFEQKPMSWLGAQALVWKGRILRSLGMEEQAREALALVAVLYPQAPDHVRLAGKLLGTPGK